MVSKGDEVRKFAENIFLVHVTKLKKNAWASSEQLMLPLAKRKPETKAIEEYFGWKPHPKIYFFAGRACPISGDMAFAFKADVESRHAGSANPFDTGGAYKGHISPFEGNKAKAKKVTCETEVDLNKWRTEFRGFLEAFFSDPKNSYLDTGTDAVPDRSGKWGSDDLPAKHEQVTGDWRAWTWEIRFNEEHPINDGMFALAMSDGFRKEFADERNMDAELCSVDNSLNPIDQLIALTHAGDLGPDCCELIEMKVKDGMQKAKI